MTAKRVIDEEEVRKSVCVTGDPADSIGKALYEIYVNRLTAARAGYLPNINNANLATIADISTLTATEIAHLDADISSRSSHVAADIWGVGTRALTDKTNFGLSSAGILAIWHELLTNIVTADTIGKLIKDNLNAPVGSIPTTPTLQATWTDAKAAFLDEDISAAKTLTVAERTAIRKSVCLTGDTASSIGKILFDLNARATEARLAHLNADISSRSSHNAAAIWSVATRALTDKAGFSLSAAGITSIWDKDISAYSGAGYAGTYLKTVYDDWLNGGRLDLILDAIQTETNSHPTLAEIEGSTVLALKSHLITQGTNNFNVTALQAIQDEAEDALEGEDLDHLLKLDGATEKYPENCATDSILAKLIAKGDPAIPSTYSNATDSLEAIREAIDALPDDADIGDLPWDEFEASHSALGSFGKRVVDMGIEVSTNYNILSHATHGLSALNTKILNIPNKDATPYMQTYPKLADSIRVATGIAAWAEGSWTEIIPVNTITETFWLVGVWWLPTQYEGTLEIGIGTVGSVMEICNCPGGIRIISATGITATRPTYLSNAIKVAANTRVAARVADSHTASQNHYVKVLYATGL